jgi:hypothetical protein
MNVNQFKIKDIFIKAGKLVVCLFIVAMLAGCFENYGRLKRDPQIQRAFETYEVPSNHNYYFYGVRSYPWAIMGLDSRYELRSRIWRKVDPNTEQFKRMVYWAWEDYGYYLYGAHIQDPDGRNIGIFYSSAWFAAVKVNKETKIVEVMPHIFLGGP